MNGHLFMDCLRVFATTAVESDLTVVYIVRAVAVGSTAPEPGLCCMRSPVTVVALHLVVRTLQGEVRLPVMVELPLQPVHRVVAQGTSLREAIRVRVAFAMALGTFGRRVAEDM